MADYTYTTGGTTWANCYSFQGTANSACGWEEWKYKDGRLKRNVWNWSNATSANPSNWIWSLSGSPTPFISTPNPLNNQVWGNLNIVTRFTISSFNNSTGAITVQRVNYGSTGSSGKMGYRLSFEGFWKTPGTLSVSIVGDEDDDIIYTGTTPPSSPTTSSFINTASAGNTIYYTVYSWSAPANVYSGSGTIAVTRETAYGNANLYVFSFTMPNNDVEIGWR